MYDVKVEYVDGKTENFRCECYYYDKTVELLVLYFDEKHKLDIMTHQIRKVDTSEIDNENEK